MISLVHHSFDVLGGGGPAAANEPPGVSGASVSPRPGPRAPLSSDPPASARVGWLTFTITDVSPDGLVCSAGAWTPYASALCEGEEAPPPGAARRNSSMLFTGSNGYDFRLTGPALIWSPVVDYHNGTYSARVRVDDAGDYVAEVHRFNIDGCAAADCDAPASLCPRRPLHCSEAAMAAGPCWTLAAAQALRVEGDAEWPPWAAANVTNPAKLPFCVLADAGLERGRWLRADTPSPRAPRFGAAGQPLFWAPYDCALRWLDPETAIACVTRHELVFHGLSRERTNFFDAVEYLNISFSYEKLWYAASVESVHYSSIFVPQQEDKKAWNYAASPLVHTLAQFDADVASFGLCGPGSGASTRNGSRAGAGTHMLFTDESLWATDVAFRDAWPALSAAALQSARVRCPNATIVYKTASATRTAWGTVSTPRMWEATRAGARAALALGLRVIDSFAITAGVASDAAFYPDGLHPYDRGPTPTGSFVSKTITMLFFTQACPDLWPRGGA